MEAKQTEVTRVSGTITGTDSKMRSGEVRVRVRESNRFATKIAAIVFQRDLMVGLIPGNHVIITGHTERSVARNDEGVYRNEKGKLVYQHIFVAEKIEPAKRALSRYLEIPEELDKGGAYGSDINESFIIGVVDGVSVSKTSRSAFVNIRVTQDDDRSNVRVVPFFGNRVNDAEKLNKGDLIAVCGSLSVAPNPPLPGVENENVVCQDILILEKAEVVPEEEEISGEDEPEETLGDIGSDNQKSEAKGDAPKNIDTSGGTTVVLDKEEDGADENVDKAQEGTEEKDARDDILNINDDTEEREDEGKKKSIFNKKDKDKTDEMIANLIK